MGGMSKSLVQQAPLPHPITGEVVHADANELIIKPSAAMVQHVNALKKGGATQTFSVPAASLQKQHAVAATLGYLKEKIGDIIYTDSGIALGILVGIEYFAQPIPMSQLGDSFEAYAPGPVTYELTIKGPAV